MLKLLIYKFKKPYHFIKTGLLKALPAQFKYHFPQNKLRIIAITGTDGKTTTSSLLHHILETSGYKTGLITTLAVKIGHDSIDTGLHVTSPSPDLLYQALAKMLNSGCSHVILEITSHGSYQYRNWGINPQIGIITNITHEHLDYHVNMKEYTRAKCDIFKKTSIVFLNSSLTKTTHINQFLSKQKQIDVATLPLPRDIKSAIRVRFSDRFNKYNASLAYQAAKILNCDQSQIAKAISTFPMIAGRMENVAQFNQVKIIVDFAHTPNAVKHALLSAKRLTNKRVIAILGSAGLRDYTKRPKMGYTAVKYADQVIFTSEDPRTENPWSIINQLKSNLGNYHQKALSIVDRGEALFFALTKLARPGDIVIILGKGHEKSMCYGNQEYAWNDKQAIEYLIATGNIPTLGKPL